MLFIEYLMILILQLGILMESVSCICEMIIVIDFQIKSDNSRKMARKNVLRSSVDEYGKWKMSGDTLLLYDNNRQQMKFIKVNNKKIAFLIDDIERADHCWKKVKY